MTQPAHIKIGEGKAGAAAIPLRYANRHGLITGATGTGKTVTLMTLAERFGRAGVPVFIPDVKGDILALARSCPVTLYDLYGEQGVPLRASIKSLGPELLSRALGLTYAQAGILDIADVYAPRRGMRLDTLPDLRAVLAGMVTDRCEVSATIGLVTPVSVGVIQRALLRLERRGGAAFFGRSSFNVGTLLHRDALGHGRVSILAADKLILQPDIYGAFLLWMLSQLFEQLPEVGDRERPRLVFFFDEAHLLFAGCPAPLLRLIEQTVRLIRSKGVGVYFVTQARDDVPKIIAEQLATRIDHSRRLGVGRAHVITLDDTGKPRPVDLVKVDLPTCELGPFPEFVDRTRTAVAELQAKTRPAAAASEIAASAAPATSDTFPWPVATLALALAATVGLWLAGWLPYVLTVLGAVGIAAGGRSSRL